MVPIAYASSEGSDEPAHPQKIASALTAHIHNGSTCLSEMIGTSRISLYLPHVSRVICTPTLLHAKISLSYASLISTFVSRTKHETFCLASSGPKLSAKLVCHSLFGEGGPPRSHPGSGTANSISSRQRDRVMVHGHV